MVACAACGAATIPGKRFCADCGAPLDETAARDPGTPAAWAHRADGDRRPVTVLFCDLVGSTALSAGLDPEDYRELIRSYQRIVSNAIERFAGHVAQYLGDGILAYFGYPLAHEDDPHRAIRAGLAMVRDIADLGRTPSLTGAALEIRVGIHTGLAVVGEMGAGSRRETLAVGDVPNVAARIQALAGAGEILATDATRRLVDGLFELQPLGARRLKGVSSPIDVYRVLAERTVNRFDLAVPGGIVPLVGRDGERAVLRARWLQAMEGHGSATLLVADPGLGKSRLVLALRDETAGSARATLVCRGSPTAQNTELHPVGELFSRVLGLAPDDGIAERWAKLARVMARTPALPPDAVALIAELVGADLPGAVTRPVLAPNERRERLLDALVAWFLETSRSGPQLLVVEDLHWVDPTTLELLGRLVGRLDDVPILCLFTARPEILGRPELPASLHRLPLGPLTAAEVEALAISVSRRASLPLSILEAISGRTDGVPLFVEELTKAILESGQLVEGPAGLEATGAAVHSELPSSLHGSLMARLDRLGGAREVAQVAAVIGRDFAVDDLAAVVELDHDALEARLADLVAGELIYPNDRSPRRSYTFRHALIQEVAYESLLRSARREHHRRIAIVLDEQSRGGTEVAPELLAGHFRRSDQPERSIEYLELAGRRGFERFALRESIAHYREALELTDEIGARGTPLELRLRLGLAAALVPAMGYTSSEVERAFSRAAEICAGLPDSPELVPALYGLWVYDIVGGRLYRALESTERMVELTRSPGASRFRISAEAAHGFGCMYTGRPVAGRGPMEAAIDAFERGTAEPIGVDHNAASFRSFLAVDLWLLGFADEAATLGREAVAIAETMEDPPTLALVYAWVGVLHHLLGDDAAAGVLGQQAVAVSEAHGITFWKGAGALVSTSSLPPRERIPALTAVLEAYRAAGARLKETHFLLRLADAYRYVGDLSEADRVVSQALEAAEETNERWLEPDLLRLRGEIEAVVRPDRAEATLRRGVDLARRHGSRMLELRCATSLARLRLADPRSEALDELATVVATFPARIDGPDLAAARAVLAR